MGSYPQRIWIIGAGRVGRMAVERLGKCFLGNTFLVVDGDEAKLQPYHKQGIDVCCEEGARFLSTHLSPTGMPEWVVPAVPIHLALEWARLKLAATRRVEVVPVPVSVVDALPHPTEGDGYAIYTTNADFLCPDNCPEPAHVCFHTGLPRPRVLHEHIRLQEPKGWNMVVITSIQLGPGIGGYAPAALFSALDRLSAGPGRYLVSTACKCHGVVHALQVRSLTC